MDEEKYFISNQLYVEFYDLREAMNKAMNDMARIGVAYNKFFAKGEGNPQLMDKISSYTFTKDQEFENRIKEISNLFQALHAVDAPKQTKKPNRKERKGLKLIVPEEQKA